MSFPKDRHKITYEFNTYTFAHAFKSEDTAEQTKDKMDLARYRIKDILGPGDEMKDAAEKYCTKGHKRPQDARFVILCSDKTAEKINKEIACGLHLLR